MRVTHSTAAAHGCVGFLSAALLGCAAGGPAEIVPPRPAAACVIGDAAATPQELSVAVRPSPDPAHAPAARTPAERLVFRQLYETLVRVDCTGTVLPGLAAAWSAEEQRGAWRFRLDEAAVFADGAPVTAHDIVASWSAMPHTAARVSAAFASIMALGERELRVELRTPAPEPYVFAFPDFAVARRVADAAWPIGSGAFRMAHADARVTRVEQRERQAGAPMAIEFRTMSSDDARAALDAGTDVLVTSDPAAVAYAQALPDYTVTALPWSRTYTLISRRPPGTADTIMRPPADALLALARDAVPTGTRVAVPPFWWDDAPCRPNGAAPAARAPARSGSRTIIYPRDDAVARGIAERLVALAWPVARAPAWLRVLLPADYAAAGPPVAAGVAEHAVLDSLRSGRGLAVVLPLPRTAAAACAVPVAESPATALAVLGPGAGEWRVTPLLDAHDHLVHRGSFGRATVESDGTIRFDGGGS